MTNRDYIFLTFVTVIVSACIYFTFHPLRLTDGTTYAELVAENSRLEAKVERLEKEVEQGAGIFAQAWEMANGNKPVLPAVGE